MKWEKFTKKIVIKSDLSVVYRAWTISSLLEKWFLKKALLRDQNDKRVSPRQSALTGHRYTWQWFAQSASETGIILKADGKNIFEFTFAGPSKVAINISKVRKGVVVELIQENFEADGNVRMKKWLECAFGWAFYLVNLKSYIEHGIDLRNKNIKYSDHVNS